MDRLDGLVAVHPGWRERLRGLAAEGGYGVGSTWRSYALQARWRRCYEQGCRGPETGCHGVPGACPGANLPGLSNHEYAEWVSGSSRAQAAAAGFAVADEGPQGVYLPASLAVDLDDLRGDDFAAAHRLGPKYRLHFPVARERWHVQPAEVPEDYFTRCPFPALVSYVWAGSGDWWGAMLPVLA